MQSFEPRGPLHILAAVALLSLSVDGDALDTSAFQFALIVLTRSTRSNQRSLSSSIRVLFLIRFCGARLQSGADKDSWGSVSRSTRHLGDQVRQQKVPRGSANRREPDSTEIVLLESNSTLHLEQPKVRFHAVSAHSFFRAN